MPEHFTLDKVTDGVFACIGGGSGAAVSNSAIVDMGDKAVVVDTFQTATAARELRDAVAEATGKTAYLVVNSHWHADHVQGNQAFQDVPIVGTPRMAELIVGDTPKDLDAWAAEIDGWLETFRAEMESEDAAERTKAERRVATLTHIRECIPGFRLTVPDLHIENRLVVEGERRVEVVSAGLGHTESDLFVWVPDGSTAVAGDLAWNRLHPKTNDGSPADWVESTEKISTLDPSHVIPGHGRPGDRSLLEEMASYMRGVEAALEAVRGGESPSEVPVPPGSEDWKGIERFREGLELLAGRDHGPTGQST